MDGQSLEIYDRVIFRSTNEEVLENLLLDMGLGGEVLEIELLEVAQAKLWRRQPYLDYAEIC
jgi:hypothetical protein